ncbi:MAG: transglutaminase domain-containing protein [Bryobacteraceae bacterium]|nr:transglutaminase domain-containing protein [Bryobacteraceae bacterium]
MTGILRASCAAAACVAVFAARGADAERVTAAPLSRVSIERAAKAAGFQVREFMAEIPAAERSNFAFTPFNYDDPQLAALREKYKLEEAVKDAKDEWAAQLLLKQWVYERIPGGNPASSPKTAQEILDRSANGERFYCTQYAITYAECAQALGWQARKIGVDRRHGPEGMGSSHHGAAEVWSNQFRKWVVMDSQSNLHFEKRGEPLSAWEIRAEWLTNGGADVDHLVGIPPNAVKKNPAIVWWNRPDEDETSTYYWIYIADHVAETEKTRHIFPLDGLHDGAVWYQNDPAGSTFHMGYRRNLFLPTRRLSDAYWSVGVVEARVDGAERGAIRLSLDGYDPYRTRFEASLDGTTWEPVADARSMAWPLKAGWNTLRLRSAGRRGITGPEMAVAMLLKDAAAPSE